MKTNSCAKRHGYLVMGGGGLLFAVAYLGMSFKLPFGTLDQPGAAIFPVIVGVLVAIASLITVYEGWRMRSDQIVDWPAGADRARLIRLLGLMLAYFLVLPWLGQILSSFVFCALLIRLLSDVTWPRVIAYALVLALSLYAVFVLVLKVPMPRGILSF